MRGCAVLLCCLAIVLASRLVGAESALVFLVRPSTQSTIVSEALTRIRGELIADGFEVSMFDAPEGSDPASVLARASRDTGARAMLGLFLHGDGSAADVWIVDRSTRETVGRHIDLRGPPSGAELLARRSVELLRASLLEMSVDAQKRPVIAPRAQSWRRSADAPATNRSTWGVEAGAQVMAGFGGVGSTVMLVGRGRIVLGEPFALRLTLSGLGSRPHVQAPEGTAAVSQELGVLELISDFIPQGWLRPYVSVGGGAYHISVEGSAAWPYQAFNASRFAGAVDAGAGIALSLSSSFALALEGHATFITPRPVIRFLEVETAEITHPLLSGALTVVGRL